MKILAVTYCFFPDPGGSGLGHYDVLKRLVSVYGYNVTVLTLNRNRTARRETVTEELDGMLVHRLSSWVHSHYVALPKPTVKNFKILSTLLGQRFDLIYTRTRYTPTSLIGLTISWVRHTPLLHTEVAATSVKTGSWWLDIVGLILDQTLGRAIARHAACVVGVCHGAAVTMQKLGARRTTTIFNGVDDKAFYPVEREGRRRRRPARILYVGRLSYMKGTDLLNQLADHVDGHAEIRAAGAGEHKLNPKIKPLGYLSTREVADEMRQADMLVLPSRMEGLPRVVQEAMSCGLPIVATNVGGTRDLVGECGFVIPPGDIGSLTAAVYRLLYEPTWEEVIAKAPQAMKQFQWEGTTKSYHNVIQSITRGATPALPKQS